MIKSFVRLILLFAAALVSCTLLAEIYHLTAKTIHPTWIAVAICNSAIAAIILVLRCRLVKNQTALTPAANLLPWHSIPSNIKWYLPSIALLSLVLIFITVGTLFGERETLPINPSQISWIIWIPIIEEIVFRVGIGDTLRRIGGAFFGTYLSVIIFSYMHSYPTYERLLAGSTGIIVGPLLLAVCCEWIWLGSRRLGPIITFHAACNATIVIFSLTDSRWLTWLNVFYQ